jgi:Holliday junction resolvase RusA-like endonuclease
MAELRITVYGKPQPAGSKRAFAVRKAGVPTGRIAVMDANENAKPWQAEVRAAAMEAMTTGRWAEGPYIQPPLRCPVNVSMTFYARRPKGHFGTGRNEEVLKDSSPPFPVGRPDALKLARGTEDALTGIVWHDDAQVVDLDVHKRYGLPERCEITVRYTPPIQP